MLVSACRANGAFTGHTLDNGTEFDNHFNSDVQNAASLLHTIHRCSYMYITHYLLIMQVDNRLIK